MTETAHCTASQEAQRREISATPQVQCSYINIVRLQVAQTIAGDRPG